MQADFRPCAGDVEQSLSLVVLPCFLFPGKPVIHARVVFRTDEHTLRQRPPEQEASIVRLCRALEKWQNDMIEFQSFRLVNSEDFERTFGDVGCKERSGGLFERLGVQRFSV